MNSTILTIVGARPQFIKATMVSLALAKHSGIQEILVHTGQHYDDNMSNLFFRELELKQPDYNLNIGSGNHGIQTGKMLGGIEEVILKHNPKLVLVYGDTNSTLAGALAASKLHIPVAHVEAGLRSYNRKMPEEVNRVLTDHISDLLFCPTEVSISNALKEGISKDKMHFVGDVMYDAAIYYSDKASKKENIIRDLNLRPKEYILATIHRAENTDDPAQLLELFQNLIRVAEKHPLVLPLHPRTRAILSKNEILWNQIQQKIKIIEPVGYLEMLMLEKNSKLIITDSGGVQKEAYFSKVPCVTVRPQTEWVELIEAQWNILVPPHQFSKLPQTVEERLANFGESGNLYGNAFAANEIALICAKFLNVPQNIPEEIL